MKETLLKPFTWYSSQSEWLKGYIAGILFTAFLNFIVEVIRKLA